MSTTGDSVGGAARRVAPASDGSSPSRPVLNYELKIASETRMYFLRAKLRMADRVWTTAKRDYDLALRWNDGYVKVAKNSMDAADSRRRVIRERMKQLANQNRIRKAMSMRNGREPEKQPKGKE